MKKLLKAFVVVMTFGAFIGTSLQNQANAECIVKRYTVGTCNLQDNCENLQQEEDCAGSTDPAPGLGG